MADPAAAVAMSVEQINAAGNQEFLTEAGEMFRWTAESEVKEGTPAGEPVGLIHPDLFADRVRGIRRGRCVPQGAPDDTMPFDAALAGGLYEPTAR